MPRNPEHDILFEPIEIGPKTMKNRFWQPPHCNSAGSDRPGTQAAFRGMKAEGGWGAVSIEYTAIHPESDDAPHCSARMWDEGDVISFRHVTDSIHKHGALAGVQLYYAGLHSQCGESRAVSRAPSAAPSEAIPLASVHEVDEDDIKAIIQLHVDAAIRSRDAGFDIIENLVSDSMIINQFLQPYYNKRSDGYGGSFENRARFGLEVFAALKKAVGDDCAIGNRYAVDTMDGADGLEVWDEGIKFIELCSKEGLCDVWDMKIGRYSELGLEIAPSRSTNSNYMAPWIKEAKKAAKVPVVSVGRITSPDEMVQILKSGQADIIGAARPSIADPFLPTKIDEGRTEDIRECIGCNICLSKWWQIVPLICTQNAAAMEEYRRGWHPEKFEQTKDPCSVLVVGAGPAGMECARVLGERGYDVHLREAADEIGGRMRDIQRYPHLAEWGRVTSYRQGQLERLGNVEVHTGIGEMSADDVLTYGADKVVIATGANWAKDGFGAVSMAPLPGADAALPQICTPEQVMAGKETGDRVAVLDYEGYFTGVGMAELLADQGKQVSIVTNWDTVAPHCIYTEEIHDIRRMIHEKKIAQHTLHFAEGIEIGNDVKLTIFYLYRDGHERTMAPKPGEYTRRAGTEVTEIACDSVILCTARNSNDGLFRELKARKPEWADEGIQAVYQIGDCHAPRLIANCVFDGHRLAREFESEDPQYPLPWIRERQVWGHETFPKLNG
ncbi:MAG: FAD-dependent oxidoreductase [Rhodospirillaceae bacterium]|nr:FAD-dependent oxidoreductase [Rhodospirillaceae bacterium]